MGSAMWQIEAHLVKQWLDDLDSDSFDQVTAAIKLLAEHGPTLGRPLVDTISGSRHRNMKELRPGSSGDSELRILFAFDPVRRAILLIGGDKSGNWARWYQREIPMADRLLDEHIQALRRQQ